MDQPDRDTDKPEQTPQFVDKAGMDALDAYRFNLSTVLDHLKRHGLEYFMERSTWGMQPVIGVPETAAALLLQVLRSDPVLHSVSITFQGQPAEKRTHPVQGVPPDLLYPEPQTSFVVFSRLRAGGTGRRFEEPYGCVIDVWAELSGELRNDRPVASVTPVVPAPARANPKTISVLGQEAVTYEPFERPPPFDVDFPVDLVFYWVDGSDRAWRRRKAKRLRRAASELHREADLEHRYRQFDELRYALRSVDRFAPWVRRIFLVTDNQRPSWLDERDTDLEVIDHSQILPTSALPSFNPRALTASLHRIPDLADHFLYMNDDQFFGRPTRLHRFFQSNGVSQFFLSKTLLDSHPKDDLERARNHSADLIQSLVGFRPARLLRHAPHAFHRPLLAELEEEVGDAWQRTIHTPFRSSTDVIPEYVHHHVAYARRLAVPGSIAYRYFGFGRPEGMEALQKYPGRTPGEVLCVNDLGSSPERLTTDSKILHDFLVSEFPSPSRYEKLD